MASPRTTLIIPVESQVRELDAKVLLACAAAERGFPVVIGSRAFVHYEITALPRGVYLAKSMRTLSELMFRILRQLGHEIVAWDEEALVRFRPEDHYRRRLSAKAVGLVSHLFAWGEDDAEILRRFPAYPGTPIHITGNPRIDLMRPDLRSYFDPEVADIRRRFGPLVLVNTNFGFVNAFASSLNLMQESKAEADEKVAGVNTRGMTPDFARGLAAHKQALFEHFRRLVPALGDALPDHTIVVRPHPAEDHGAWRETAGGRDNIRVVNEKNVIPWLLAAKALVHNSCTTAVEAAVLGTPAVAYRPVIQEAFDSELPHLLSHEAFELEELVAAIRAIAAGEGCPASGAAGHGILERHLASLEGPLASDRMVAALCDAGYHDRLPAQPDPLRYLQGWLHARARTALKQINRRRAGHRNADTFHQHRFPGTSVDDLRKRIGRLSAQLGRFEDLRVREISRHIFRIDG
jgi:surface carbohydrate biosynthesis protein